VLERGLGARRAATRSNPILPRWLLGRVPRPLCSTGGTGWSAPIAEPARTIRMGKRSALAAARAKIWRAVRHPTTCLYDDQKGHDENGIKFAFPTVQVAGEGAAANAAVAQRALELSQPAAA